MFYKATRKFICLNISVPTAATSEYFIKKIKSQLLRFTKHIRTKTSTNYYEFLKNLGQRFASYDNNEE